MTIEASAPGKVVVSGEYAVLDGAPAICMAISRRARVTIERTDAGHHSVVAPGFSSTVGRFVCDHDDFEWLEGGADYALVEAVCASIAAAMPGALALSLDTQDFIDAASGAKIGIGSSAALTVAMSAALAAAAGRESATGEIALTAHRRFQHGVGSGVDVACSLQGGIIEYRSGQAVHPALVWPDGLTYAMLWSGVPASTGAMLERLSKQVAKPSRAALAAAAERVASCWAGGSAAGIVREMTTYIGTLHDFSVDHGLGIFDAGHGELVSLANDDVVYKPCGAGGGDVGIVLAEDEAAIVAFVETAEAKGFVRLGLGIDSSGVQAARENE